MDQPSQSVTFNIPHDLLPANWQALIEVYKAMPGWVDGTDRDGCPMWWPNGSTAGMIGASVEPSGLLMTGNVSHTTWERWIADFEHALLMHSGFVCMMPKNNSTACSCTIHSMENCTVRRSRKVSLGTFASSLINARPRYTPGCGHHVSPDTAARQPAQPVSKTRSRHRRASPPHRY